ncbi:MAG: glycosyltransferase family 39 protein, partial [Actinobacteria bacterium]|nr:glycosyltransferase family 39 protein [Actinomycetota bacterium]
TAPGRPRSWPVRLAWWAPALLAAAAMTVAGLWGLARDSAMGNDEIATRWAALLGLRDLGHLLSHGDAVHGLYYLIMHAWVAIGGSSPAALRVPSVIAMVIAVALATVLARKLTGSGWAALFTGLIMALTPAITFYAQTARSYAMVLACVVAATLVLVHALEAEAADRPAPHVARWWIGYAALVTVSSYLNEMALLALAAHAVTVLLARYGSRVIRHWLIAAAAGGVLVLPLLALSVHEQAAIGWIPRPGITALRILFRDYFGATTILALLVLACAVVAVLPSRNSTAPAWWNAGGISLQSVAAPLLLVPAGLLLVESRILDPLYTDRYVLYGEVGAALLAGGGAVRIGQWAAARLTQPTARRTLIWLPGVVLCVLALVLQLGPDRRVRTPDSRLYNFAAPSRYINAHARAGDGVLYFGTLFRKAELGYPQYFTKVTDFAVAVAPRQADNFRGVDKTFAQTLPLMLRYQRIWVFGYQPSLRLPPGLLRRESRTLMRRFSQVDIRHFRGITVTLWQRR